MRQRRPPPPITSRLRKFLRSPKGAQTAIGVVLLLALGVFGTVTILRSTRAVRPFLAAALADVPQTDADRFADLFLAAWRKSEGPTLVEAVLYHAALQEALVAYSQKSLAQQELNDRLEDIADASILPVLVLVTGDSQQADDFDFTAGAELAYGRGVTYRLADTIRLDPLNYASLGISRAYLLVFDRTGQASPASTDEAGSRLILTLRDLGGVPVRQFAWDPNLLTPEF